MVKILTDVDIYEMDKRDCIHGIIDVLGDRFNLSTVNMNEFYSDLDNLIDKYFGLDKVI